MPGVQILPTQPPRPGICFDRWQFDHRAIRVSAETRITFQDNVSTVRRGTFRAQRWKPEFANNTAQLRKVIAVLVWQHAHGRLPFPEGLENDLPRLEQLAKTSIGRWNRMLAKDQKRRKWHHKSLSEHQRKIIERHVFTTSWSGGTLQILAAVAYLSWNRGLTSCDVGEQLYMTPWHVRIVRYRLCNAARRLGFETFAPHHSRRQKS